MKKILKIIVLTITLSLFASPALPGGNKYGAHRKTVEAAEAPIIEAEIMERELRRAKINDVYVVHFILDGLNAEAWEHALDEELLPTVKSEIIDKGATFGSALSLFPSTSAVVYQAYTTGLWPGRSGIPHLQRFDREGREAIDYLSIGGHDNINDDLINLRALMNPDAGDLDTPTAIFELLEGHPTAAIYSSFYKGSSITMPKVPVGALWSAYVTGNVEHIDAMALNDVLDVFREDIPRIPRYTLVGLYSSDVMSHKYGPQSEKLNAVLAQFDNFMKNFMQLLRERGIADKTYIIISSDHGMHETGKLFRFKKLLEKKGIHLKPKSPKDKSYTMFVADRGVVSSHIYLKHDNGFEPIRNFEIARNHVTGWNEKIDLIDTMLEFKATEFLIVRNGDRKAKIFGKDGKTADVTCTMVDMVDYCIYKFDPAAGDPLGYSDNMDLKGLLDGRAHSTHEWEKATSKERYPDAIANIGQIFNDGRAGDIFITARAPYGLREVKKGNHGGLTDDDMRIFIAIEGPTVPAGKYGTARPIDIYPLLVQWFGLKVPSANYDGVNPFTKDAARDEDRIDLATLEIIFEGEPPIYKMIDVRRFVKEKVIPAVKTTRFARLAAVANEEITLRHRIVGKIDEYLKKLEAQKKDDKAPEVCDPRYLNDHISIATRTRKWIQNGSLRLEDVRKILTHCANPDSVSCIGL